MDHLTAAADNGGPAFPVIPPLTNCDQSAAGYPYPQEGMSLLDYFIAHAPAEPQQWFLPVMPTECPLLPDLPVVEDASEEEVLCVRKYAREMPPSRVEHPVLRAYVEALRAAHAAIREWTAEAEKQRYVQWPAAWANEMLKARQS